MSTTQPEPTFTFRLYHYVNGLGQNIWRAKMRGGFWYLWQWRWVDASDVSHLLWWGDLPPLEWENRSEATEGLQRVARRIVSRRSAKQNAKLASRLKLVLIEDVVVSPAPFSRF